MPDSRQPIASPEDQTVTFVELFFDLVFVFSVTQVVVLFHHEFNWVGAGQSLLAFWLVWWAWTQFTWALNAANTAHPAIEFATLGATAVAFFMTVALPGAFHGHALAFAIPYVLVRVIGLSIYAAAAWQDPRQRDAVKLFAVVSVGGLAAVLAGGIAGGAMQYWLWGLAILLDIIAAGVGARHEGWNLHPEHFGERHGLFVIIALGETLIIAAGGLTDATWSPDLVVAAILAVVTSCGLWWTYFPKCKPTLEHAMNSRKGSAQSKLARDVYSLIHFPMLCGVIAYAAAIEVIMEHPAAPLDFSGRLALAVGVLFFVGGMAAAMWRATCGRLAPRVIVTAGAAGLVLAAGDVPSTVTLAIACTGVVAVAAVEQLATAAASGTLGSDIHLD